jgi:hypothetical protein
MDHHGTFSVVQPKTDVPQMRRFAAEKSGSYWSFDQ